MQSEQVVQEKDLEDRKRVYEEIRDAFAEKYDFLGAQVARETLLSAASWNIQEYSDPPMRFRNHVMLTWKPGWLKSSMLRKMKKILGDDMVSTCGKLTAAVIRGSVEGGRFSPPKPLRTPIVVSTEFGQTTFEDELLNTFLALLEEGKTNVSLNKLAGLSEGEKSKIQENYGNQVEFKSENEFDLNTNFVFWGATHDPTQLNENALKSRFNVVTPAKPLTGEVTEAVDSAPTVESLIDQSTIKACRRMLKSTKQVPTDFQPPSSFYTDYTLTPRESRDVQAYMAARNWWGLEVNPDVMENYIDHMKHSRRIASMGPKERVLNLIFDNPLSYEEIMKETQLSKVEVHRILQQIDAGKAGTDPTEARWVVRSGSDSSENDLKNKFLEDV